MTATPPRPRGAGGDLNDAEDAIKARWGQTFDQATVTLDGNFFVGCVFRDCVLEFTESASGGFLGATAFAGNCTWHLVEAHGVTCATMPGAEAERMFFANRATERFHGIPSDRSIPLGGEDAT